MDVYDIRRRNLAAIIDGQFKASHAAFSRYIDVNPAQINRLFYEPSKGGRNLGDQLARHIEDKLELKRGWLDIPHWLIAPDPIGTPSATNSYAAVTSLRQAVPYFNSLSSNRIVIYIDSDIIDDERALSSTIQDIALLDSVGVRIVLVHGSRVQIDRQLAILGQKPNYCGDIRITDTASLNAVKLAIGETRIRIEGLLSLGLANSPLDGARLAVVSGNAVVGRPIGVKSGVDFCYSGIIRHIETDFINGWLNTGSIVLLSSLAYSPTGEIFNVQSLDVATQCASALRSDKLIVLSKQAIPKGPDNERVSIIDSSRPIPDINASETMIRFIDKAAYANQQGVSRCHIIDGSKDGALIAELFTQSGSGTMITDEQLELIRSANLDDIAAILAIIRPLEERGVLVPRSKELIENHIEDYLVMEREGQIIGCAALHPYTEETIGEIACVAVTNEYQGHGIAHKLVSTLEQRAKSLNLKELFVLTTDTSQWFQRRHYRIAGVEVLPMQKRNLYDEKRKSRIYLKKI